MVAHHTFFQNKRARLSLVLFILFLSFCVRLFGVTSVPPSLYWEEVALGYDAYSILHTGKDHHGHWFPIVALESFGDYKPALYAYTIIPFLPVFGLSTLAIRFPSVISGVILTYLVGLIARCLYQSNQEKNSNAGFFVQVTAMIFVMISPWAIQFSRGGWEVNLATTLVSAGIYFGLLAKKNLTANKLKSSLMYYLLCAVTFICAMYTYHATRLIAPVMGLVLAAPLFLDWRKHLRLIVVLGVFSVIGIAPIALSLFQPQVNHRLQETSAFGSLTEIQTSNMFVETFHSNILAKILFHRYVFYGKTILANMFSHLRLDYLFISGDSNPRHSVQYFGLFYPFDSVLLLFGIFALIRNWKKSYHLLWIWWIVAVFPASLTTGTPHALRTLPSLPVWIILMALGALELKTIVSHTRFSKVFILCVTSIILGQTLMYSHFYFTIYPTLYDHEWQFGYQQLIHSIHEQATEKEPIYITREQGRPAMYYWFFSQTDPKRVQEADKSVEKDQGEYLEFERLHFVTELSGQEKGLIASSIEQSKHFSSLMPLQTINDLEGKPIWFIYRVE